MITGVGIADIFSNGVIVCCPQDEMIRKTLNQVAVALYYYFFKYYDTLSKMIIMPPKPFFNGYLV